jgi:hypothetical protein
MFTDNEFPLWHGYCDQCGTKIKAWEKVKVHYDPMKAAAVAAEQARNEATASANQASQVVKDQQAQERQRLEGQIQDLKAQHAKRVHQADCSQTQTSLRSANASTTD